MDMPVKVTLLCIIEPIYSLEGSVLFTQTVTEDMTPKICTQVILFQLLLQPDFFSPIYIIVY